MEKASYPDFAIKVICQSGVQQGFKLLPRQRVVDWTFGWLIRCRRLVHNYEQWTDALQDMILVAMGRNLLGRNAHLGVAKKTLGAFSAQ